MFTGSNLKRISHAVKSLADSSVCKQASNYNSHLLPLC